MIKVLIVDDNPRDRRGIRGITDWSAIGVEIVGDCANGMQALRQVEELNPDIVLTDISMPVMDGIDMSRRLKEKHPSLKIIFMSCHYDFQYAKSAIDLDIYGYVVKPFERQDIVKAMSKVIHIIETENLQKTERVELTARLNESVPVLREQFLRDLLFGVYKRTEEIGDKWDFLQLPSYADKLLGVIALKMIDYGKITTGMNVSDQLLTALTVKKVVEDTVCGVVLIDVVQLSPDECSILVTCGKQLLASDTILDAAIAIKEGIESRLGLETSIGISKFSDRLEQLHELHRQSVKALKTHYYSDGSHVILYEEIEDLQMPSFEEKVNVQRLFGEVKDILQAGNTQGIPGFIDNYLGAQAVFLDDNYVKSFTLSVMNIIQIVLLELNESVESIVANHNIARQKLNQVETIDEIKKWLMDVITACRDRLIGKSDPRNKLVVKKIREMIHSCYKEKLSIDAFAQAINFSMSQTNNIFKRETGRTIFDDLTEYRIQKAKELLKDPFSKIYEVSESVGYTNKSHFIILFKKYTGMSPTEFKHSLENSPAAMGEEV